ncbi:BZIP domain-containing protein [Trichonephila inaurata madagascariensis]|uniref:BZIP domain-containing protein n=1 Tax=Trichonephila inaurata madagascariensis TaxID=2747483 RepID=A0A8X6Y3K4_9ARAC|nr:BZIP domain-containing protein [Trichonephila inaurata madagascariensis]
MTQVLPSTVEELNLLQNSMDFPSPPFYSKVSNKGFENIPVEKTFKRLISLPDIPENWNISNFDSYLNFEDNFGSEEFKVIESVEDRLVPEEGDQRQRCESFSSVSSSMDEKRVVYQNFGVKSISTVRMDSGSTCISSDHSYVSHNTNLFRGLEAEETYQNLDMFLQQVPEMTAVNDNLPSPMSSNDSTFELSTLHSSFSLQGNCTQDSFMERPLSVKRHAEVSSEDELYSNKSARLSDSPPCYTEVRRKNNIASKNCRKTRKEKQKEMEIKVSDLEKEREGLKVEVQLLEELIQAHKMQLYAILQKR